ncbi:hypothetical protein ANCCAN_10303 [Ancylostoma caninum]|uniref:Uncharacterized protein n=1 Tax=Ancylostoma caninum TaxID=29170 RepID=A0A368GJ71_ANCCA|nr:hypothetical protein ANCCAN_10303 [Ancylostoma caninum]
MLSDSSKASRKNKHRVIHIDSPSREIPLKKKPVSETASQELDKGSQTVKFDPSSEQPKSKGKKLKPKSVTPKSKSSSSTSKSSSKSYLKETVTRTEITTTKEYPEDSDTSDPTKGVVKKREVKRTITTNIYPEEKPMGPLPIVNTTERRYTTRVESPKSRPVEPFSKYILTKYDKEKSSSSSQSRPQNNICGTFSPGLRTAVEGKLKRAHKIGPQKPKDPYRPKKGAKFHVDRAPRIDRSPESSKSGKVRKAKNGKKKGELEKADESTESSGSKKAKKARTPKKTAAEKQWESADKSTESSTSAKAKKVKTPKKALSPPKYSPRDLPPWGVPSAEVPIEVELPKKERKAPSPPSTLQYSSSQSSLLGKAIHRRTPPSGKRHKKKKKHEQFVEAGKSESYLEHQLQYAIAGRKKGKKQVRLFLPVFEGSPG